MNIRTLTTLLYIRFRYQKSLIQHTVDKIFPKIACGRSNAHNILYTKL